MSQQNRHFTQKSLEEAKDKFIQVSMSQTKNEKESIVRLADGLQSLCCALMYLNESIYEDVINRR